MLSRVDLAAIRQIVREELQRAHVTIKQRDQDDDIDDRQGSSTSEKWTPEPDAEPWISALEAERDERKRLAMTRARSYMRVYEDWRKRARRFLGLPMGATLTEEQMLAFARHHAETWHQARAKSLATRAAKRAKRNT